MGDRVLIRAAGPAERFTVDDHKRWRSDHRDRRSGAVLDLDVADRPRPARTPPD